MHGEANLKGLGVSKYEKQLRKAKSFHTELGEYYHPNTFAHCAADSGQPAWHKVSWQLESLREISTGLWSRKPTAAVANQLRLTRDAMNGSCELQDSSSAGDVLINRHGVGVAAHSAGGFYRAWLGDKDDSGDATVPRYSGVAPRSHVSFFAEMRGFEHQGSYKNETVQAATLVDAVIRAVAEAEVPT